ncbi:hypothetical protein BFV93_4802 [Alteromonas macleodii]|nr:hypothetical protein BFV93_4802 [Alteromonas macleodii]
MSVHTALTATGDVNVTKSVLTDEKGKVVLPNFYEQGLHVVVHEGTVHINVPGYRTLDDIPDHSQLTKAHQISQFLFTHFHPEAGHDEQILEDFSREVVSPTLSEGGQVPIETIKDWLFYRGKKNDLVGGE